MRSTYPHWIFDGSPIEDPFGYGERAVEFTRRLKHPLSTAPRKALVLSAWQERIIRRIYGPRHPDGSMIVKKVLLLLPRGNRKTSLAAVLALLHTIGPEAPSRGQAIIAAKDRDQGKLAFEEARSILLQDKRLLAATRIYNARNSKKLIEYPALDASLEVLSSDGGKAHGLSPTFILMDELHQWKGRELWEALTTSRRKRRPLIVICSTAGAGQECLLWDEYLNACKVASGEKADPSFLPIIFSAEPDDDWQDEAVWHKANPGLVDGFISIEEMRIEAADARDRPKERYAFMQFGLNMWMGASRSPLFEMSIYDAAVDPAFDLANLEGLPCFLGVDMSVNGDLTAVVGAWRHGDGRISIHPWFFVPGDDLRVRADVDGVPYERWRDEGLINAVAGAIIRPEAVEAHIRELYERFAVEEVAFDPHLAATVMQRLFEDGLPVVGMRQGPLTMAPAIGALERTVNGRFLHHSGHPILRHHFDSVVASRNDTGLVRMHKGKRTDRIDGAVAAAMAVGRASQGERPKSIFESDDFDPSSVVLSC